MEAYFLKFRKHIIGIDQCIETVFGDTKKILYADWTASGRNYKLIEERIQNEIMPFVANTHSETSATGMAMTYAYHEAQAIIKKHVNANEYDVLISSNAGMTGVTNKFLRILGLRIHERFKNKFEIPEQDRPIVFITHMEHHSNQTSWIETIADVEIIPPDENGLVSLENFEALLRKYSSRKTKYAAITACSNVTGIMTPYHEIAKLIHTYNGFCFVDFACSAPYVHMDMHPIEKATHLDAIYFSPHKFLGGPGSTGILIFNSALYSNAIPDDPGGGTVDWTNPWGEHKFLDNIEEREDGGTPAFLQTIKVAMCIQLKEEMGINNILLREKEQMEIIWKTLSEISNIHILAEQHKERLGILSFYIEGLHYNAGVKLLNDKFGIQSRGGCSCAGTYGHYLLHVNVETSHKITDLINHGDYSSKPGWIRISIHPTLTDSEIIYLAESIKQLALNFNDWMKDYILEYSKGQIKFKDENKDQNMKEKMIQCLHKAFE
ncbi:MAG: aminotransferase class V-fold PLP-dependent enzyme [Saprospiraceae bacterium]|nr:aminotransferase class V-fold PLP-dependent enzyme [Saprospiraceae bacterium]